MLLVTLRNNSGTREKTKAEFKKRYGKSIEDEIVLDDFNSDDEKIICEFMTTVADKYQFVIIVPPKSFNRSELREKSYIDDIFSEFELQTKVKILDNKTTSQLFDYKIARTLESKIIEKALSGLNVELFDHNYNEKFIVVDPETPEQLVELSKRIGHLFLTIKCTDDFYDLESLDVEVEKLIGNYSNPELIYLQKMLKKTCTSR